ncbi:MAG TPA: radical SAM protein [Solirubrobacteraceae bacterium]|nr:radical SAM protein [Solirubrobacteraceae bacterium]
MPPADPVLPLAPVFPVEPLPMFGHGPRMVPLGGEPDVGPGGDPEPGCAGAAEPDDGDGTDDCVVAALLAVAADVEPAEAAAAIPVTAPAVASVPVPISTASVLVETCICQNLLTDRLSLCDRSSLGSLSAPTARPGRAHGPRWGIRGSRAAVVRRACEHTFVRWSNLTIDGAEQASLPGYRDEAVVRRFDAPEALQTRFYEVRARSVLNRVPEQSRMPFRWTINPYRGCSHACVFCFARPTHRYLGFDAGRDFEREIVVKVNAPEVLRAELARASWTHEHIALGTNTDPYQWVEGRYRLMEGIWQALRDAANPCSVLTKSPLLLRDLGLMLEVARRTSISACLSIPTLDEKAWRATEPHTPSPRARLEAVAELNRAGIPTGVLVAPLMPGVNDAPHQVEPLLQKAAEAGATSVGGVALHLRGEVRQVFMDWLSDKRPDLVARYRELYRRGAYAPPTERERLATLVRGATWPRQTRESPRGVPREPARALTTAGHPRASAAQGSLF